MPVALYQSFYREEQRHLLDPACIPYDNTENLTPDLREYPQMQNVCRLQRDDQTHSPYGLVSWKFQQKAMIPPSKFIDFVEKNPENDFWFVNPCPVLEAVCLNPWEQGEWWHKGITRLAQDTIHRMFSNMGFSFATWNPDRLYPKNKMFFANYFIARPRVWNRLFLYMSRFYNTIELNPDLKARMSAASGYATDPNMSHFIFLFERMVPTFLMENPDIRSLNYDYSYDEVSVRYAKDEWDSIQYLSHIKSLSAPENMTNYQINRAVFLKNFPNSVQKE